MLCGSVREGGREGGGWRVSSAVRLLTQQISGRVEGGGWGEYLVADSDWRQGQSRFSRIIIHSPPSESWGGQRILLLMEQNQWKT